MAVRLAKAFGDSKTMIQGGAPEQVEKIAVILARLDVAEQIGDMNGPGLRPHRLAGNLKGFWSVTVTANWRAIFRFDDGKAYRGRPRRLSLRQQPMP
jgi:plasmid maintenance system killer protein